MFSGTLSQHAQNTLALLGQQDFLKSAYMAGGSSLALQLGHRRSIDFDFFIEREFSSQNVNRHLKKLGTYVEENETPKTMVGLFNNVKFSFFHYPYSLIAATTQYSGISLASLEDIAAMKLVAITDRGTKKDYIDLYVLARKKFTFEQMFDLYDKKYQLLQPNLLTLIKSLQYFAIAEESKMPEMIEKITWVEVKQFLQKETLKLANKYL